MIYGMYMSSMGAMTNMARHASIANNLANTETTGYKPETVTFRSLLAESELLPGKRPQANELMEKIGGGVWMNSTPTVFEPGPIRSTGNPLDMAIRDSNGFFQIERDGQVFLSRAGEFTLNPNGEITTPDGQGRLLDDNGAPITITGPVEVSKNGTICRSGTDDVVARVGLVRVDNPAKLEKTGENMFSLHEATITGSDVKMESGALEGSAVEPVNEMVAMIEATRAYEANMKFIQIQDDTLGRTVTTVGSVS